jgi:hypothetical protein
MPVTARLLLTKVKKLKTDVIINAEIRFKGLTRKIKKFIGIIYVKGGVSSINSLFYYF